jgi:conjugal transfer pilin signal peptidase TrbI
MNASCLVVLRSPGRQPSHSVDLTPSCCARRRRRHEHMQAHLLIHGHVCAHARRLDAHAHAQPWSSAMHDAALGSAPCAPRLVPVPAAGRDAGSGHLALHPALHRPDAAPAAVFNWTPSLPYHVALVRTTTRALRAATTSCFASTGSSCETYPGLRAQPFFKQVAGLPGDVVQVSMGAWSRSTAKSVGTAKTHTFDRQPLAPIEATVIPPGHYYVQGTSADSFDSRYRSSGLVRADQVIATLTPLF